MRIGKKDILRLSHISFLNQEYFTTANGVSTDSRSIKKGNIFVALKGETFDGHNYISDVIKKQPSLLIISDKKLLKKINNVPVILVKDTLIALGELAGIWKSKFKLKIVAITGSNGKTTTKEMAAAVLKTKYNTLKTEGNLNNQLGVPFTLFRINKKHEIAVIEMGMNHFGEIAYLCHIAQPDTGCITNVGHAHIEFFGSLKNIAKAKGELFDYLLKNNSPAIINTDDINLKHFNRKFKNKITFGFTGNPDIKGEINRLNNFGQPELIIRHKKSSVEIQLRTYGLHTANNALAAAAIGIYFGIPLKSIKSALEKFKSFKHRMQVFKKGSHLIINDAYNANPDSVESAMNSLTYFKGYKNRIAVIGDMLELGNFAPVLHRKLAHTAKENNISTLFLFGPLSKYTFAEAKKLGLNTFHFSDKTMLFNKLTSLLNESSVILFKGSRKMKMEEICEKLLEKK